MLTLGGGAARNLPFLKSHLTWDFEDDDSHFFWQTPGMSSFIFVRCVLPKNGWSLESTAVKSEKFVKIIEGMIVHLSL